MKLTKHTHASLVLDNGTTKLIIDPGSLTELPEELSGLGIIIVTDQHGDHFDVDRIKAIVEANETVEIYSIKAIVDELAKAGIDATAVDGDETIETHGYTLHLHEGDHASVNGAALGRVLTVTVDDFLYYPSDSYMTTDKQVTVVAAPTAGPWSSVDQTLEFINNTSSPYVLATHNGIYNKVGNMMTNKFLSDGMQDSSRELFHLENGESREL